MPILCNDVIPKIGYDAISFCRKKATKTAVLITILAITEANTFEYTNTSFDVQCFPARVQTSPIFLNENYECNTSMIH